MFNFFTPIKVPTEVIDWLKNHGFELIEVEPRTTDMEITEIKPMRGRDLVNFMITF